MDKYEYKVRADEIKDLIAQGEYVQAAEIADTIDWRRVKSVMMLCTISDLYKINRRYEDARNMLLLAYERRPGGRTICYSLCELSIKMEDFVPAVNYYKEFVQVAPKDPGRYILQYKLYEAQDVSLEERIGVLEELKKRDYREKWAYELAYLYHRVGLGTRCVEECDELILWFGEGKYVIKAMELKMLHQPLSPSQQEMYDRRFDESQTLYGAQQEAISQKSPYYETQQAGTSQEQSYYETQQGTVSQEQSYYETQQGTVSQEQSYYDVQPGTVSQEQPYYGAQPGTVSQEQPYYETQPGMAPQEQFYYETQQGTVSQEQPYYDVQQGTVPQEQFYYETRQETVPQESTYYGTQQDTVPQEQFYYGTRQEIAPQEPPYYAQGQNAASGYEMGGKTRIYGAVSQEESAEQRFPVELPGETVSEQPEELDIQVKPMDLGQYNTINLQAEIAAGLREVLEDDQKTVKEDEITRSIMAPMMESETESLDMPEIDEVDENDLEPEAEVMEDSEVFFGETGEIGDIQSAGQASYERKTVREIVPEIGSGRKIEPEDISFHHAVQETALKKETVDVTVFAKDAAEEAVGESAKAVKELSVAEPAKEEQKTEKLEDRSVADTTAQSVMEQLKKESRAKEQVLTAQPPKEIANVLSQESDGQISLVMPESEQIEKQITGQMNLEDILREWERMKQENAERRKEEVRQHVLQHTGEMFTAFEAAVRDGLLEQLESDSAKASESTETTFAEEAKTDDSEITEDSIYEEPEAEIPEDGYPEENEDWDSLSRNEPEEDLEEILKEAEQEVAFGDVNEAEEAEENEEAGDVRFDPNGYAEEEEYDPEAYEEPEVEAYEEEEPPESDPEVEEKVYETEEAEPVPETYEDDETAEPEQEAYKAEEAVAPGSETAEETEENDEESDVAEDAEVPERWEAEEADSADGEGASGQEASAAQDPRTNRTEKPAKPGLRANKAEEPAKKKPETAQEPAGEDEEHPPVEREKGKVRGLTKEEKELYGPYIQSRASREQLVQAIDNISMAAYTGNIIITGEEGMDTVSLAKNMIREVQLTDSNFAGKVAKISGQALNKKDVEATINQLASGALIIQKASGMDADTAKRLHKALQQESFGIIIILEDVKKAMNRFLEQYPRLAACFTARMDVESLSNGTLVAFGRKYAREREYSIDDMGILALHTRIDEMQTSDHVVTVLEVKELVDNAIRHANRKTLKHFFDILFARRYDEEDMIILSERDFV